MGYEKTTLEVFKRRLNDGEYSGATGARRAVGKAKEMSDKDKKTAHALIEAHAWGGKKAAKAAKAAAKPVAKATVAKKGARAAKRGRAPKGGKSAAEAGASTENPQLPAEQQEQSSFTPAFTYDDVARNPIQTKNMAVELVGALQTGYNTYVAMAKEDPAFPMAACRTEVAEGMQRALALCGSTAGALHAAAIRVGVLPPPPNEVPAASGSSKNHARSILDKAADTAEKVHGTGKYAGPSS